MLAKRVRFVSWFRNRAAHEDLVFLDETSCDIHLHREYGYSFPREPIYEYQSGASRHRLTLVAALRYDRPLCFRFINGSLNTARWRLFAEEKLIPSLAPEHTLVMDNLNVHKDRRILRQLREAGVTVRFQPPYSPDLNPIEICWAHIKRYLRDCWTPNVTELIRRARHALSTVTSRLIHSWYRHCSHVQVK